MLRYKGDILKIFSYFNLANDGKLFQFTIVYYMYLVSVYTVSYCMKSKKFNYTPRQNEVLRGVYCFHVVRPSVRPCVRPCVHPSVRPSVRNVLFL